MFKMMLTVASIGIILGAPSFAQSAPDSSAQKARNFTEARFIEGDATGAPRSLLHNQSAGGPDFVTSAQAFRPYRAITKPTAKKLKTS